MSLTDQPAAYNDCQLIWQKAVDTPGGIRFPFHDYNSASTFQMRMNKCRSIQRRISRQVNAPTSPKYDTSEFDSHMVQIRGPDADGSWWIYVRPHGKLSLLEQIEPIYETEPEVLDDVRAAERLEAELTKPIAIPNHRSPRHAPSIPAVDLDESDLHSDLE